MYVVVVLFEYTYILCLSNRMLEESMAEGGGGLLGNCDNPLLNVDSLIQILLWLPVISLLRFKSVCKSWRAIIENPFFIHTHATFPPKDTTTTTTTTSKLATPLFFRYSLSTEKGNIFTISGDEFEVLEDLGTPLCYRESHYKDISMAGCCNGIICLHNKTSISLWNPATKQFRFLPKPFALEGNRNVLKDEVKYFVGFGFGFGFVDGKTMDYKVFQITSFKPDGDDESMDDEEKECSFARGVQVYSLSTDSWKCIDASTLFNAHPNLIIHPNQGHYLNGSYLFMARYFYEVPGDSRRCRPPLIMSFDFTEEIFRTINLPFDWNYNRTARNAYLLLFGQKIAFANAFPAHMFWGDGFDIWVLNDQYSVNESWSKFYTVIGPLWPHNPPRFITDNGEFAILNGGERVAKLKLLNLVTQEIKDLQCDSEGQPQGCYPNNPMHVGIYKPSLVPIGGGNGPTYTPFGVVECDMFILKKVRK